MLSVLFGYWLAKGHRLINLEPDLAVAIVKACIALHNLVRDWDGYLPEDTTTVNNRRVFSPACLCVAVNPPLMAVSSGRGRVLTGIWMAPIIGWRVLQVPFLPVVHFRNSDAQFFSSRPKSMCATKLTASKLSWHWLWHFVFKYQIYVHWWYYPDSILIIILSCKHRAYVVIFIVQL